MVSRFCTYVLAILSLPVIAAAGVVTEPGGSENISPGWAIYLQGLSSVGKGNLDQAERQFRDALAKDPKRAEAFVGLGEVALQRGNRKLAAENFDKAVSLAPRHGGVLTAAARFKMIQGDRAGAERLYLRAADAESGTESARLDLGDLYLLSYRKPDQALNWYRKALTLEPQKAMLHHRAGIALTELKQYPAAVSEFEAAAKLEPKNPLSYQSLGRLYLARNDYDKAADAFARGQRAQPAYVGAYLGRGDALMRKGDKAGAITEYRKAVAAAPKFAPSHVTLAAAYQESNRMEEARASYLKALDLDPKQVVAYNNLSCIAVDRQDWVNAVKWAQSASKLQPGNPLVRDTLGWAYFVNGQTSLAATIYADILTKTISDPVVYYHAGVVFQESRNTTRAKAALEKALSIQKDFRGAEDARKRLSLLSPGK